MSPTRPASLFRRSVLGLLLAGWSWAATAAVPATFTLQPSQSAQVGGAQITLLRLSDSRCPPHASCLLAGNVTASLLVREGSTLRTVKVFLPGRAALTPAGLLRLQAATRLGEGKRQRLTFRLN